MPDDQAATTGGGVDALTIALGILGSVIAVLAVTATVERGRRRKHGHAIA